ncbi:toxin glutamine deamidase domain-containing protein [Saccharopolyspora pogona]|uniref:toxin glutamine deamidase domain-containing protein n=1 Tax=Saccharopolyspora pogona TaxID=333966 RepID=UPI0021DFB500|nr:toxin glutamine deamidase domain-containing protein [Saccharopolyspora pogona]
MNCLEAVVAFHNSLKFGRQFVAEPAVGDRDPARLEEAFGAKALRVAGVAGAEQYVRSGPVGVAVPVIYQRADGSAHVIVAVHGEDRDEQGRVVLLDPQKGEEAEPADVLAATGMWVIPVPVPVPVPGVEVDGEVVLPASGSRWRGQDGGSVLPAVVTGPKRRGGASGPVAGARGTKRTRGEAGESSRVSKRRKVGASVAAGAVSGSPGDGGSGVLTPTDQAAQQDQSAERKRKKKEQNAKQYQARKDAADRVAELEGLKKQRPLTPDEQKDLAKLQPKAQTWQKQKERYREKTAAAARVAKLEELKKQRPLTPDEQKELEKLQPKAKQWQKEKKCAAKSRRAGKAAADRVAELEALARPLTEGQAGELAELQPKVAQLKQKQKEYAAKYRRGGKAAADRVAELEALKEQGPLTDEQAGELAKLQPKVAKLKQRKNERFVDWYRVGKAAAVRVAELEELKEQGQLTDEQAGELAALRPKAQQWQKQKERWADWYRARKAAARVAVLEALKEQGQLADEQAGELAELRSTVVGRGRKKKVREVTETGVGGAPVVGPGVGPEGVSEQPGADQDGRDAWSADVDLDAWLARAVADVEGAQVPQGAADAGVMLSESAYEEFVATELLAFLGQDAGDDAAGADSAGPVARGDDFAAFLDEYGGDSVGWFGGEGADGLFFGEAFPEDAVGPDAVGSGVWGVSDPVAGGESMGSGYRFLRGVNQANYRCGDERFRVNCLGAVVAFHNSLKFGRQFVAGPAVGDRDPARLEEAFGAKARRVDGVAGAERYVRSGPVGVAVPVIYRRADGSAHVIAAVHAEDRDEQGRVVLLNPQKGEEAEPADVLAATGMWVIPVPGAGAVPGVGVEVVLPPSGSGLRGQDGGSGLPAVVTGPKRRGGASGPVAGARGTKRTRGEAGESSRVSKRRKVDASAAAGTVSGSPGDGGSEVLTPTDQAAQQDPSAERKRKKKEQNAKKYRAGKAAAARVAELEALARPLTEGQAAELAALQPKVAQQKQKKKESAAKSQRAGKAAADRVAVLEALARPLTEGQAAELAELQPKVAQRKRKKKERDAERYRAGKAAAVRVEKLEGLKKQRPLSSDEEKELEKLQPKAQTWQKQKERFVDWYRAGKAAAARVAVLEELKEREPLTDEQAGELAELRPKAQPWQKKKERFADWYRARKAAARVAVLEALKEQGQLADEQAGELAELRSTVAGRGRKKKVREVTETGVGGAPVVGRGVGPEGVSGWTGAERDGRDAWSADVDLDAWLARAVPDVEGAQVPPGAADAGAMLGADAYEAYVATELLAFLGQDAGDDAAGADSAGPVAGGDDFAGFLPDYHDWEGSVGWFGGEGADGLFFGEAFPEDAVGPDAVGSGVWGVSDPVAGGESMGSGYRFLRGVNQANYRCGDERFRVNCLGAVVAFHNSLKFGRQFVAGPAVGDRDPARLEEAFGAKARRVGGVAGAEQYVRSGPVGVAVPVIYRRADGSAHVIVAVHGEDRDEQGRVVLLDPQKGEEAEDADVLAATGMWVIPVPRAVPVPVPGAEVDGEVVLRPSGSGLRRRDGGSGLPSVVTGPKRRGGASGPVAGKAGAKGTKRTRGEADESSRVSKRRKVDASVAAGAVSGSPGDGGSEVLTPTDQAAQQDPSAERKRKQKEANAKQYKARKDDAARVVELEGLKTQRSLTSDEKKVLAELQLKVAKLKQQKKEVNARYRRARKDDADRVVELEGLKTQRSLTSDEKKKLAELQPKVAKLKQKHKEVVAKHRRAGKDAADRIAVLEALKKQRPLTDEQAAELAALRPKAQQWQKKKEGDVKYLRAGKDAADRVAVLEALKKQRPLTDEQAAELAALRPKAQPWQKKKERDADRYRAGKAAADRVAELEELKEQGRLTDEQAAELAALRPKAQPWQRKKERFVVWYRAGKAAAAGVAELEELKEQGRLTDEQAAELAELRPKAQPWQKKKETFVDWYQARKAAAARVAELEALKERGRLTEEQEAELAALRLKAQQWQKQKERLAAWYRARKAAARVAVLEGLKERGRLTVEQGVELAELRSTVVGRGRKKKVREVTETGVGGALVVGRGAGPEGVSEQAGAEHDRDAWSADVDLDAWLARAVADVDGAQVPPGAADTGAMLGADAYEEFVATELLAFLGQDAGDDAAGADSAGPVAGDDDFAAFLDEYGGDSVGWFGGEGTDGLFFGEPFPEDAVWPDAGR